MLEIKEWNWVTLKKKDISAKTITCPYCNVKVQAESNTRIIDADSGQ